MCKKMYKKIIYKLLIIIFLGSSFIFSCKEKSVKKFERKETVTQVLKWEEFSTYIQEFNRNDEELYVQYYPNNQAEEFLKGNIPYFNCPDQELEKTYYFRWWTFRKHIKITPAGFVITEFLPDVGHAGKYNTINCPAGHHFYEGRWLHNQTYLQSYANFWFKGGGSLRSYSFWAPNSILAFAYVHQNKDLVIDLLPDFDKNYQEWEKSNLCDDDLFWQIDDRDGMEVSVGGSGKRATINSYMYGDAKAIAEIAEMAGDNKIKQEYTTKAEKLRSLILSKLWDGKNDFFKTLSMDSTELIDLRENRHFETFLKNGKYSTGLVDVRELHGYTPWYFSIPDNKQSVAWKYVLTTDGFKAPFGPTTAEQSHPGFKVVYEGHGSQWNGPSWPFSTSITLKAMANLLRDYDQSIISKYDFVQLLLTYSNSHRLIKENGEKLCWIDENLNPFTGDWIARTMRIRRNAQQLKEPGENAQQLKEPGKDYNHSEFCDIIISDLIGIRPSMDDNLTLEPLIPADYWDWFCLDNVKYHNRIITIVWDRDGSKYQKGKGFLVFVDGKLRHKADIPGKIKIQL